MVGARSASPQTVIVRNAGPNPSSHAQRQPRRAGAAVAGSDATFSLDIAGALDKQETDVHLFVDSCGAQRRIFVDSTCILTARRMPAQGASLFLRRPEHHYAGD